MSAERSKRSREEAVEMRAERVACDARLQFVAKKTTEKVAAMTEEATQWVKNEYRYYHFSSHLTLQGANVMYQAARMQNEVVAHVVAAAPRGPHLDNAGRLVDL